MVGKGLPVVMEEKDIGIHPFPLVSVRVEVETQWYDQPVGRAGRPRSEQEELVSGILTYTTLEVPKLVFLSARYCLMAVLISARSWILVPSLD